MPTNNPTKEIKQGPAKRKEQKEIQKQSAKQPASTETDKKTEQEQQGAEKKSNQARRRIFPIWLRIVVVLLLSALALILGLMFGYGVLGDGKPTEVLELDTWQHIVDIVTGK
ncbi:DNA-directed RNA polymerase subunit beta [Sediminibacillus albus]|uniref:DNA-directed RNA polymerase subunit beta n=1 Tax=Sediminibacillus albus TaxID=407036 RepID=A0A1G8ZHX7_9BACI|nr:DNA-directed RNA polymerase subunit beta [Sediminibacillus albus]SDK14638.1 DNA-directed RNA polymerase subunit beta [Sediminibacillus albus]